MITNLKYSHISMQDTTVQEATVFTDLSFDSHSVSRKKTSKTQKSTSYYSEKHKLKNEYFITQLLNSKKNQISLKSSLLPLAVRYSFPGLVIFERPPTYQVVQYIPTSVSEIKDNHEPQIYRIAIPWQLYIISYDPINFYCTSVKMFFTQSSLHSTDQVLFMAPIPNFFTNSMLCRPMYADMDDVERYSKDLSGIIASAYDWIWNSGFNHDLSENVCHLRLQNKPVEITSDPAVNEAAMHHGHSRSVTSVYLHRVLKAWEKIDINNILNIVWPNPSLSQHFEGDPGYYNSFDYDRFEISCEDECGEDNCKCYPELQNEIQTFNTIMKATLNLDYQKDSVNRNLDKAFLAGFELLDC